MSSLSAGSTSRVEGKEPFPAMPALSRDILEKMKRDDINNISGV